MNWTQIASLFAHGLSCGLFPGANYLYSALFTDKMYPQPGAPIPMAPPQKPETFMLSTEAQRSLPHDAQVALQQVDNRMSLGYLYPPHQSNVLTWGQ